MRTMGVDASSADRRACRGVPSRSVDEPYKSPFRTRRVVVIRSACARPWSAGRRAGTSAGRHGEHRRGHAARRRRGSSDDFPLAEAWWASQLDRQTYSDPTEGETSLDDCRPADQQPAGDPDPSRGTEDFLQDPARWNARYEVVPSAEYPPGSDVPEDGLIATGGRVYMRWGWTSLDAENPLIDWRGWGYRKIVAKHGWGPTALARTEAALLTTPSPDGAYAEYVARDAYDGASGRRCDWVVVVQRDRLDSDENPEASEQAPMGGIITAHGRWARGA